MNKSAVLSRSIRHYLPAAALLVTTSWAAAVPLTWDADPATTGTQDSGPLMIWKEGNNNWYDDVFGQTVWANADQNDAYFGYSMNATATSRALQVDGTVVVSSLTFSQSTSAASTSNPAFNLTGIGTTGNVESGRIQLVDGATITLNEGSTSADSQVIFGQRLALAGANINMVRSGASQAFVTVSGPNVWTGTLNVGNGLFLRSTTAEALTSLDAVQINAGATLSLSGGGTYENEFHIEGQGNDNSRGSLRIESGTLADPTVLLGKIVLLDNNTVISTQNSSAAAGVAAVRGGIYDQNGPWGFKKTGTGTLMIQGASKYRGITTVGTNGTTTNPGTLLLDFKNGDVAANLLYNGVAANQLVLEGTTSIFSKTTSTAGFAIDGKDATVNSQTFNGLSVTGFTTLSVTSGVGGSVNLALGEITRAANSYLAITGPASGTITTTNANGLLGLWASYNSSWAGVTTGVVGAFTGDTNYLTGANVVSSPTSNLRVSSASSGGVAFAAGTTDLRTVSMTDVNNDRTLEVGSGQTLRLGQEGGFQITGDAKNLTIGSTPGQGTVTAGTTAGAEMYLSNFSATSLLRVNSGIANNAAGAVNVIISGPGTTVLAGNSSYTGTTTIQSGIVEVLHDNAFGAGAGNTTLGTGSAINFTGRVAINEAFTLAGTGFSNTGVLRNVSGTNRSMGAITLNADSRFHADAGRFILGSSPTTTVLTGNFVKTFSGPGTIEVAGVIAGTAGISKGDTTGLLILSGANTYTGANSFTGGPVRVTHNQGLGTGASNTTTTITGNTGQLQVAGGITTNLETFSINSNTSVNGSGVIRSLYGTNTLGGTVSIAGAGRIQADAGSTLIFDVATGNALENTSTTSRTIIFSGGGDIILRDAFRHTGASAGTPLSKDGPGTLTLLGEVRTGTGAVSFNGGRTIADHTSTANIFATTQALTFGGGILEVKGGAANSNITVASMSVTANLGLSQLVIGANTNLTVTSTWARNSDAFLMFDLSATGSALTGMPGATAGAGYIAAEGNLITGTVGTGAYFTLKNPAGRYDFASYVGGAVTRLNAATALPLTTGSATTPYLLTGSGATHALTGNVTSSTIRVDTTAGASTLDLAGRTLTVTRFGFLIDGTNDFTLTNSTGTGNLTNANTAIFFYNYGTGKFTLNAPVVTGTAGRIFFIGDKGNLVDWTAPTTAGGATYIYGNTVRLTHAGAQNVTNATTGNGSGFINLGSGGILELTTADLTRNLGTSGAGNLGLLSGDSAGFSAYGADRKVSLQGNNALVWGSTTGFLANSRALILGSAHANAIVDLTNDLDLNGGNQTVQVLSQNLAGRGGKISGSISGVNGSFTKTGQGILDLAGASTYTGTTTVAQGTLQVSGSLTGTSDVFVNTGAKLALTGNGAITGGNLTLNNNTTLSLEIGTMSANKITLDGGASLSGHIDLTLALTADPLDGFTMTLIDGALALSGYAGGARFFYNNIALNEGDIFTVITDLFTQDFSISYLADGGRDVTLLAVPEPSTAAVLCASVGMLLGLNRFRRRTGLVGFRG